MVYALGRTQGCSKYSKAENNKTPPLYKYVEGLRDTHMTNCVNRLRNHDGLKIAETHKTKPMQQKCKALQQIRYLFEQENLDGLSSDREAELGKLCNFLQ